MHRLRCLGATFLIWLALAIQAPRAAIAQGQQTEADLQDPTPRPTPLAATECVTSRGDEAHRPGSPRDDAVRSTALRHVDTRAAGLLMSGQRGGGIEGELAIGPGATGEGRTWTPFWVELRPTTPASPTDAGGTSFELFAYALDENGEVDGFQAHTARVSGGGVKFHDAISTTAAARTLRVLAREMPSGEFFLSEIAIPCPKSPGRPSALLLFPDADGGWRRVVPPSSEPASDASQGIPIDGARRLPQARPLVSARSRVQFFIAPWQGSPGGVGLVAQLRNARGMAVDAGSVKVIRECDPGSGVAAAQAQWVVPEVDPGRYTLEVSTSGGSAETVLASIPVVVLPADQRDQTENWAALAPAPALAPASGPRELLQIGLPSVSSAAGFRDEYAAAVRRCAEGQWRDGVQKVFDLERRAIPGGAGRTTRPSGANLEPADLLRVETTAAVSLGRRVPDALAPLLKLHHDVFAEWWRQGDPTGRNHELRLIGDLVKEALQRPAPSAAREAATAVLASLADTTGNLGAPTEMGTLLRLSLRVDPAHAPSLLGLAVISEWYGKYFEAVTTLRLIEGSTDAAVEGRLRLAVNLLRTGRAKEAATSLATSAQPPCPPWIRVLASEELAVHLLDTARPGEARRLLADALGVFPGEQTLVILLAFAHEALGQPAQARIVLAGLDRAGRETYRETPRVRYARWPFEVFAAERRRTETLAIEHLGDLSSALTAEAGERRPR